MKNIFKSLVVFVFLLTGGILSQLYAQVYCYPSTSGCSSDYIASLQFDTYYATPGCSGTGIDTSNINTSILTLYRGKTYHLSIVSSTASDGFGAFIDYNKNGSFGDAGEMIGLDNNGNGITKTYGGGVTIPTNATPQNTRMRVMSVYGALVLDYNQTCTSFSAGGECIDYLVTIAAFQHDVGIVVLNAPQNLACPSSTEKVQVIFTNYGTNTETNIPFVLKYGTTTVNATYKRSLAPTKSDTFTIGTFNASSNGIYKFSVYTALSGDGDHTNDTINASVAIKQPTAPKSVTVNHCGPASGVYLHGASTLFGSTTLWYKNSTTDTVFAQGDSVRVPYLPTGSLSYYAESKLPNTGMITKGVWSVYTGGRENFGNFFDVTPKTTITIDSFDINIGVLSSACTSGGTETVNVFYKAGSYVGSEHTSSDWTKVGAVSVAVGGCGNASRLVLPSSVNLPVGTTYGWFIQPTSGSYYTYYDTTGTAHVTVSDNFMTIKAGAATGLGGFTASLVPGRDWDGDIYYHYPQCNSARVTETINILQGVNGALFFKSSPFQGQYNTGDIYDPDNICLGDTNTYQLSAPKGFSNGDFGTKWTITNISFSTVRGTKSTDTAMSLPTGTKNTIFKFFPKKYADSVFILKFNLHNIATGCDSLITRIIHVRYKPITYFGFTNACLGFPVIYKDSSTIAVSNVSKWTWDFGDGSAPGTLQNPTHVYGKTGSYVTTLTATSAEGCGTTISRTVNTYAQPTAKFTDVIGCNGSSTSFKDASLIATGSVISVWRWHFGDNTDGFTQNTSHVYKKSGPYNVKLIVTTSNGCKDSLSALIRVQPTPVASFTYLNTCVGSTIYISNSSIDSTNKSTYNWNFGDGVTSTVAAPSHIYKANGTYNISLKVTSKAGCIDSIAKVITPLPKPNPNFFTSNGCIGQSINFADSSHSDKNSLYAWDFGDGTAPTSVKSVSIKHSYKNIGTYTVLLTITNGGNCSDTQSHKVNIINFPKAGFTTNSPTNTVCLGKPTIFTNTSTGTGLSYLWDFGDGSKPINIINPNHSYTTSGTFNAQLKAFNQYGCPDSSFGLITINPLPDIQLWSYKKHGYEVTMIPQDSTIGNFTWYFGTTTNDSSSKKSPTFTYPSVDATYTVKLVVTNSSGCVSILMDNLSVTKSGIESISNSFTKVTVYPNPFEGSTNISYKLTATSKVNIGIYDAQGKLVERLKDGIYPSGEYSDAFNAKKDNLQESIYILKMYINDKYFTTKLMNFK